jgi:antitoxin HicB
MPKPKTKGRIGSSFDSYLDEEGIREEVEDAALKEIIADQISAAMKKDGITKSRMAARMQTSRRQLDRLLDPHNHSVTLLTLRRAATALGRRLRVELR